MKILITAGGTQERIDQIRCITNMSTGQTALGIAQYLHGEGYREIIFVHAARAQPMSGALENIPFVSSFDLESKLKETLQAHDVDVIIHAAAVSDFVVDKIVINGELFEPDLVQKLSSLDDVELVLRSRSKIIEKLKGFSRKPHPLVIGFKLTNTEDPLDQKDQVLKLSLSDNVDFVVHNELREIKTDSHPTNIYFKDSLMYQGQTKKDLNKDILKIIKTYAFNTNAVSGTGFISETEDLI
jgi:phosphopantothenoylcysteine synthetase/decarboxylase